MIDWPIIAMFVLLSIAMICHLTNLYLLIKSKPIKNGTSAFAVGDSVQAFGNIGTVKSIATNGLHLEVTFAEAPNTVVFTICGRCHSWNKRPSLEKV